MAIAWPYANETHVNEKVTFGKWCKTKLEVVQDQVGIGAWHSRPRVNLFYPVKIMDASRSSFRMVLICKSFVFPYLLQCDDSAEFDSVGKVLISKILV